MLGFLPRPISFFGVFLAAGWVALTFWAGAAAAADGKVETIAGGRTTATGPDAGFSDGNALQVSQFNTPFDCALDADGNLLIADLGNGKLRKLDLAGNRSSTLLSGLSQPSGVAVDKLKNIYLVTHGDGQLRQISSFGSSRAIAAGFFSPSAVAVDSQNLVYVVEDNGRLTQVNPATGGRQLIASGFGQLAGVAVLASGVVVVSDSSRHRIEFIDPGSGGVLLEAGSGVAGFQDGPANVAQFNQPQKIAAAPDGSVVVADRANHRVRRIAADGVVTTLYGVNPADWEGPECTTCDPIILPGWLDGSTQFAEAREPVGVTVGTDGTLFATEVFYHIIRKVTGLALTSTGSGGGTNSVVLPPVISPNSGYFPMGVDITVQDPNTNPLLKSRVFFTTDGTEPTTNSFPVLMNGNTGTIHWRESLRDLTSLKVKIFLGADSSVSVSGVPSARNEVGVPRDLVGGIGSTLVVPVVVNLKNDVVLRSMALVVQMSPSSSGAPAVSSNFRALNVDPLNDFIPVAAAAEEGKTSSFTVVRSPVGDGQRLGIAYVSTNSHFVAKNFAVVAQLAAPISAATAEGMHYRIEVLNASATTDKGEGITLDLMPARDVAVQNLSYLVGDTAPAAWYNAGDFGDGDLQINDADRAFNASLGFQVPFPFSDAFDAMDAFPSDSPGVAGGDGQIRFLDWQFILQRAFRFDPNNWRRHRIPGGRRTATSANLGGGLGAVAQADTPAAVMTSSNGPAWFRPATFGGVSQGNAAAGTFVSVPIYARVAPGYNLSGLQFRIRVDGTPAVQSAVSFQPAPGLPPLLQPPTGFPANEVGGAWNLSTFNPPLEGSNVLGTVSFQIPFGAAIGQAYSLAFVSADGSPEEPASYQIDTVTAKVWVGTAIPAAELPAIISDEWKTFFFGSAGDPSAAPSADPDGDGIPNWREYLAGTDPVHSAFHFELLSPELRRTNNTVVLVLRWATLSGRTYQIESADWMPNGPWTAVASVSGTGQTQEFQESNLTGRGRFYRIRLQPQ